MAKCSQCDNKAMFEVEGHLLCLHCQEKMMQMQNNTLKNLAAQANYLHDMMYEISGLGPPARLEIPQPITHQSSITQNLINVDRSVIGTINTGTIATLNQAMSNIHNQINPDLAKCLSEFTKVMLENQELNEKTKQELIEEISFLSEQILAPKQLQKKTLIEKTLSYISSNIQNIQTLMALWPAIHEAIKSYFGF